MPACADGCPAQRVVEKVIPLPGCIHRCKGNLSYV